MYVFLQLFGMLGLAETAVGFAYALTNRDSFTNFEEVFFLAYASLEVAAEVLFLILASATQCVEDKCCNCLIDGGEGLFQALRAYTRDPLHNAVTRDSVYGMDDFAAAAFSGVLLSLLSVVFWASFYPVWGFSPADGAEDLRMALSIASAVCVALVLLMPIFCIRNDRLDRFVNNTIYFTYGVEKVFIVTFLLSDVDRLCSGSLGRTFVALLLLEFCSVFIICMRIWGGNL